jgi:L-threonylcarbamoyladenylate synthase
MLAAQDVEETSMHGLVTRVARASVGAAKDAGSVLAAGGLVAFPTETVYGLGADATNDNAVAKLYAVKERPSFNPLIAHVADLAAARHLAVFDDAALRLAHAFWPGPLTLVLPKAAHCPVGQLATAGLDTIAVRVPSHPAARQILAAFGKPVVAPSANRSGKVSPTTAQHVLHDLRDRIELLINDGPAPLGIESTIVACINGAVLLRPGAIDRAAIEKILGAAVAPAIADTHGHRGHDGHRHDGKAGATPAASAPAPLAPGMLASHYAPRTPLRMNATEVAPGEALLAFGAEPPAGADNAAATLNLSERGDLVEAAANLFAHLRSLDTERATAIAVAPIPEHGIGEAINDRLRHAAAPREVATVRTASGKWLS